MSKIIFITSEKELNLEKYGIEQVFPNNYTYSHFPCLKGKKYVYNFENFNKSVSFKKFIGELISCVEKDNNIVFLVCEETDNKQEIDMFNNNFQNRYLINICEDDGKLYDLIYKLENNALLPSSEYSLFLEG